ncbi:MAG: hypothetical protein ACYC5M_03140 [Anaerolineae bacterium]
MSVRLRTSLLLLCVSLLMAGPIAAQTPQPTPRAVRVTSPVEGSVLGGVVSILGTVDVPAMQAYALAFGAGAQPSQWIQIGPSHSGPVENGRLAFWDTTQIPDGVYTLRLRVVVSADKLDYVDVRVESLQVANAPRTATPEATALPSYTPTPTEIPTATPTPWPTISLEDGVSAFLYLTLRDQSDPICSGAPQRYSLWISNIGAVSVTNIILTDTLPTGTQPLLDDSTPGGVLVGEQDVVWELGDLEPGETRNVELQVEVPSWLEVGRLIVNRVSASCDQVPYVAVSEASLFSNCPWLQETAAARPLNLGTPQPSATPRSATSPTSARPTLQPSPTVRTIAVEPDTVERGLDLLTLAIAVALGVLLVVTAVLIYRRVIQRR